MAKFRLNRQSANTLLQKWSNEREKFARLAAQELHQIALDLEGTIKEALPHDTGAAQASVEAQQPNRSGSVIKVSVTAAVEYMSIIEFGRRAGGKMPPPQALVGWAARHGLIKGGVTADFDTLSSEDKSTVWAIARSIGKMGTEGKYPMTQAMRKAEKTMLVDLATRLQPFFQGS